MIQAVYIISRTGVPIFFQEDTKARDDVTKVTLFSGLISAIRSVLIEIDAGEANYFTTQTHEIYLEATDNFAVAIVKDKNDEFTSILIEKMIAEIITDITFHFEEIPEVGILSKKEEKKMEDIILDSLSQLKTKTEESAAVRKLKDSIW